MNQPDYNQQPQFVHTPPQIPIAPPKPNGAASFSFLLGLLSLILLFLPQLGVVAGAVVTLIGLAGRSRAKRTRRGRGYALVGLLLGLLVVSHSGLQLAGIIDRPWAETLDQLADEARERALSKEADEIRSIASDARSPEANPAELRDRLEALIANLEKAESGTALKQALEAMREHAELARRARQQRNLISNAERQLKEAEELQLHHVKVKIMKRLDRTQYLARSENTKIEFFVLQLARADHVFPEDESWTGFIEIIGKQEMTNVRTGVNSEYLVGKESMPKEERVGEAKQYLEILDEDVRPVLAGMEEELAAFDLAEWADELESGYFDHAPTVE